jgi:hypothetical protein
MRTLMHKHVFIFIHLLLIVQYIVLYAIQKEKKAKEAWDSTAYKVEDGF